MIYLVGIILVVLLGLIHLVNKTAANSIAFLTHPDKVIQPVDAIDDAHFNDSFNEIGAWARNHGFTLCNRFLSYAYNVQEPIKCAAWYSDNEKTWVLIYCAQGKTNIDFVTKYTDEIGVTTGSTKDALTLPNLPKAYTQAFDNLDIDALHQKHLDARAIIERAERVRLPMVQKELIDEIKKALAHQARYIMQLPFWKHRGVYWFFVRRNLLVNRPITRPKT